MLVPEDLVYLWEFVCLCLYSCVCVLIDLTRDFEHAWEVLNDCLILSII